MTKINQALLTRLEAKLGVNRARVYALIQNLSIQNRVPRRLGALLLAGENGISIQKYATTQDLSELRGIPHSAPALAQPPSSPSRRRDKPRRSPKTKENTVFVVHGRDSALTDSVYSFLGALGLKPQEWGHAIRAARGHGGNPFVNDAVTRIMEAAQAIVVVLSPDDEAKLKSHFVGKTERAAEGKLRGQARANVIFETGIAIGSHHRKTIIIEIGDVKGFTDIGGMHILKVDDSSKSRNEFANRLKDVGCTVNTEGDHWLRVGDFAPAKSVTKRLAAGRR